MSATLAVRLHDRFPLRALRDRIAELTGADLALVVLTPEVVHAGAAPEPAPPAILDALCGPGGEQPDGWLRLATGTGVADLMWTDVGSGQDAEGGVWLTVSATWRTAPSILLAAYASVAAAHLGASAVTDEDSLLSPDRHADPDALLAKLRRGQNKIARDR